MSDDRSSAGRLFQTHGHRSVSVNRHFLLQAPQCPCSVRKQFSKDHCCRGRSKPGCRIVGSHTRWELTTWADFQLCLHRLLMSTGCNYLLHAQDNTFILRYRRPSVGASVCKTSDIDTWHGCRYDETLWQTTPEITHTANLQSAQIWHVITQINTHKIIHMNK